MTPEPAILPELADHPRYRILKELGRGGMGIVYLAEHRLMDRRVAIKVIHRHLLIHPRKTKRFLNEMRAIAKLKHPNIVLAYEAEQIDGLPLLVMEYVHGTSLAEYVRSTGLLSISHACDFARQAALGLQHAHEQSLVHRDVKPGNLLLAANGEVKVADFGLAAIGSERGPEALTESNVLIGTPEYMSPEQASHARSADIRADVYSLGCTLYFLLTGRPPFNEKTVPALLLAHQQKAATPLPDLRRDVSEGLWAVVAKMLSKNCDERQATPAVVAQELGPFCESDGTAAAHPRPAPPPEGASTTPRMPDEAVNTVNHRSPISDPSSVPPPDMATPATRPQATGDAGGKRPPRLDCIGKDEVSAAETRKAQEAWARYLGRQIEEEEVLRGGVKLAFVLIPPGRFLMGSPKGEANRSDDELLHEVTLTEPFYLGKYQVTQAQYEAVTGTKPSYLQGKDLPVEQVSWTDIDRDFLPKLHDILRTGHLYRLPTEAEWEYSCRGGAASSKPFGIGDGTSLSSTQANFDGSSPYGGAAKGPYLKQTCNVGLYQPNALGLYDMHGNVWEWCADWYEPYGEGAGTNPSGPAAGVRRVIRGGGWSSFARRCRAAFRSWNEPGNRGDNLGFRLARVPSGSK